MGFLDDIKSKAGWRVIKKELKRSSAVRQATICNLNDANSVAILYKVKEEEDYKKIMKFVKYLKGEFGIRTVKVLGYFDDKDEPFFLQSKLEFDFFTRKELSWNGIPTSTTVDNFVQEKYDVLIDFMDYVNIPLRYVLLKSQAKLKVGRFSDDNEPFYDVMINDAKEFDFEEYANQVVHYLTMFNAK